MIRRSDGHEAIVVAMNNCLDKIVGRTVMAADEIRVWVEEDDYIKGLVLMALMGGEHAQPADEWWLAYAWTHPDVRGEYHGVPLIAQALRDLYDDGITPLLFRRPDPTRPLVGAWNYRADRMEWRFLSTTAKAGFQLYTAQPLDPFWGLD